MASYTAFSDDDKSYNQLNRELMLTHRGKYIYLHGDNGLEKFDTSELVGMYKLPDGRRLRQTAIELIAFFNYAYNQTGGDHGKPISEMTMRNYMHDFLSNAFKYDLKYVEVNLPDIYNYVWFFSEPVDFIPSFNLHNLTKETLEIEKNSAKNILIYGPGYGKGRWTIRQSSLNLPADLNLLDKLMTMGIKYYVLTYVSVNDNTIRDILITQHVGSKWEVYDQKWNTFFDCLLFVLDKHNLKFSGFKSDYYIEEEEDEIERYLKI